MIKFSSIIIVLFLLLDNFAFGGFASGTLIQTPGEYKSIEKLHKGDLVCCYDDATPIIHKRSYFEQECIQISLEDIPEPIICSKKQKFYLPRENLWKSAEELRTGDILFSNTRNYIPIIGVSLLCGNFKFYDISVNTYHTYFVTQQNILVHNFIPAMVIASEAAAPMIFQVVRQGFYAGCGLGLVKFIKSLFKKHKSKWPIEHSSKETKPVISCSGGSPGRPPNDPNDPFNRKNNFDKEKESREHPHGRYEDASYHTPNGNGRKSPCPKDGQKALDNSIPYKKTVSHRIGISCGQFVVLHQTRLGLYHGHVRTWNELSDPMKKALEKAGLVTSKGKIIK